MSKIVFADKSELPVSDVSSIYGITFNTVDEEEVAEILKKFTDANLSNFKILNDDGTISSEGKDFTLIGIQEPDPIMGFTPEQENTTTILCRAMTTIEKKILSIAADHEATAGAVEELASILSDL